MSEVLRVHDFLAKQNLPLVERVEYNSERWYRTPDETNPANYFASVTNILSVANPKPLVDYFKRTSYRKQTEQLEQAADLGTHIHEVVDADLQGEPITAKDLDFQPYDLTDWFKRWQKLKTENGIVAEALEVPVVHTTLGYAGTLDIKGTFQTFPALMDAKSGHYGKRAGHQMIAYKKAYENMIRQDSGLRLVGLSLPWNKPMKTFLYEHEDFVWTSFRAAFHLWKDFNFTRLKKMGWKYLDVKLF